MKYDEGERDLVMLQHKFIVEWQDGREVSARFMRILFFDKSANSANDHVDA